MGRVIPYCEIRYCETKECEAPISRFDVPVVSGSRNGLHNGDRPLTLAMHLKATGHVRCTTCIMASYLAHSALVLRRLV